jgi:hypothetical protein
LRCRPRVQIPALQKKKKKTQLIARQEEKEKIDNDKQKEK